VEIYNQLSPDPEDDLLELEFHTEYVTIEPGASINASQIWRAFNAEGIENRWDQILFLNEILTNDE
jgi:hypothetical protein